jgi:hypothetical protein
VVSLPCCVCVSHVIHPCKTCSTTLFFYTEPWQSPAAGGSARVALPQAPAQSTKQRWAGRGLEFHKLLLQRCQEQSQRVIEIVESASVANARGSSIYTRTATSLRAIKTEPQTLRWAPFKAFSTAFSNSNVM